VLQHRVNQKVAVSVVYICAMLMNSLDSTVVNVALPTLSRQFHVDSAAIESIIVGYLVSLAVFIPASGWLGDRFGHKRILLIALALFVTASALCGAAQSLDQLVLFRILQGAGGGLLTPVGMALLFRTFPPEERVGVARVLMFATIIGPAAGPILGGFMIEHFSWRWIFYINLPVGISALLFGLLCLEDHPERQEDPFDIPGFLLAGSGFAFAMYALSEGSRSGWTAPVIVISGLIGIALLAAFVFVELRTEKPMVQLRVLANRLFRRTMTVSLFATAAFLGTLFAVPLFLQDGIGVSPLTSGLTVFPEAIGVVVSTQLVARIYPRIGPSRLMSGGLVLVAAVLGGLSLLDFGVDLWLFRALMFGLGAGMACIFVSNQAAALADISREMTGRASMLYSVQRQIGAACGVALLSTIMLSVGARRTLPGGETTPDITAYRAAFLVAAGLALIGAALATRVPDEDAEASMRKPVKRRAGEEPSRRAANVSREPSDVGLQSSSKGQGAGNEVGAVRHLPGTARHTIPTAEPTDRRHPV
jgi:EmrB/QacA subfamily drug resistance transporter